MRAVETLWLLSKPHVFKFRDFAASGQKGQPLNPAEQEKYKADPKARQRMNVLSFFKKSGMSHLKKEKSALNLSS